MNLAPSDKKEYEQLLEKIKENDAKKESYRHMRREVVDNARLKKGEYGVVDKLF